MTVSDTPIKILLAHRHLVDGFIRYWSAERSNADFGDPSSYYLCAELDELVRILEYPRNQRGEILALMEIRTTDELRGPVHSTDLEKIYSIFKTKVLRHELWIPLNHHDLRQLRKDNLVSLKNLHDSLSGMAPLEERDPHSNRTPIELKRSDLDLLIATVKCAIAFDEVERWDSRVINVVRSLNAILLEIEVLLNSATTIAGKQVLKMLRVVAQGLRKLANAADGSDGKE